jgi:hypothetical protein
LVSQRRHVVKVQKLIFPRYNNLLEARPSEREVSAALRQGDLATLNIYSMG